MALAVDKLDALRRDKDGVLSRHQVHYCDEKVANREIRVWHFVIENGY